MTEGNRRAATTCRRRLAVGVVLAFCAQLGVESAEAGPRRRGSVRAAGRSADVSRSGNRTSWQGRGGRAAGSREVTRTGADTATIQREMQTRSGGSREVTKDVEFDDGRVENVERQSTATDRYGRSVEREREAERDGGRIEFEGEARTNTGREADVEGVAGRDIYGRPAVAADLDTRYYGDVDLAAVRGPYGSRSVVAGPYGARVSTRLPSGYRTVSYHGRPYYTYGGAYYRPYYYGGMPYYYPIPPPYYVHYGYVPVGAILLVVAGATYYASEGAYYEKTTDSQGEVVYQTVPAPAGASLTALPADRVAVTVAGVTYYLAHNTFYRRVVEAGQEKFLVVTPPQGVVMVQALPAEFEVKELNVVYFVHRETWYVPYLSSDGQELYVVVDAPPQPPAGGGAATEVAGPATRTVYRSIGVPAGTSLPVRLAADLSSATSNPGERFQAFLDQDLWVAGQLIAAKGSRVYGRVLQVEKGDKMKTAPAISAELTDLECGGRVVSIVTQPIQAAGKAPQGARRLFGGAALGAAIGGIADGGEGAAIGAAIGAGTGLVATAASPDGSALLSSQSPLPFQVSTPFDVQIGVQVAAEGATP